MAGERRRFQDQELITANPFSFIFNRGEAPRIVWRDLETVRRLGGTGEVRVRWFDEDLKESAVPGHPGRWSAWIESVAPNSTPVRRSMTFFCRPPGFLFYLPDNPGSVAPLPGPIAADVWREHEPEIALFSQTSAMRSLNDTEAGAVLIAGLAESKPLGRQATSMDSAIVRDEDSQLALKLKVLGLTPRVPKLQRPRHIEPAAAVLHDGPMIEAKMAENAPGHLESLCQAWAADSHEPFATLVARHGVIILDKAFGRDRDDKPITLNYRCDVYSITKTITALLFAQFVDQRLVRFDDSIGAVFPDFPNDPACVPTFRQCFAHVSGLTGHGDWGGAQNAQLENIILNGIDANHAGKAYVYSGMGYDLSAKAMEILAGMSWRRLYQEQLYSPLGVGDVPMDNASAGAKCTARELAILAQLICNRGSYGNRQFFSQETFSQLLPEDLSRRYPDIHETEGIGMHWIQHPRRGRKADSNRAQDLIFSKHAVGHGSLSASIFIIDLDRDLVIVQVREKAGDRYGEWSTRFLEAIVDLMRE